MLMNVADSILVIVDVQKNLLPVMSQADAVLGNLVRLVKGAHRLGVPVIASEQYPKGIGPTVDDLRGLPGFETVIEKMTFSCLGETNFVKQFAAIARPRVILAGIESHVCVLQTAFDFIGVDAHVCLVADAVDSRAPENKAHALERMRNAGAEIVTTEMVLFEWMRVAGTPEFKEISALIK
ncbi:MAG: hydrolase [Magnetospiraceae bacterium]